jgi:hypothetical protein
MLLKEEEILKDFLVYAFSDAEAKILIFAEVKGANHISYLPLVGFLLHLLDRDLPFRRRGK